MLKKVALKVSPGIHSLGSTSNPAVQLRACSTVRLGFLPDSIRTGENPLGEVLSGRTYGKTKLWLASRSASVGARTERPHVPRNTSALNGDHAIPSFGVVACPKSRHFSYG